MADPEWAERMIAHSAPVSVEGEDERLRQHDAVVAACEAYVFWMHKRGVSKPTALQQAVQAYDAASAAASAASPSSPTGEDER